MNLSTLSPLPHSKQSPALLTIALLCASLFLASTALAQSQWFQPAPPTPPPAASPVITKALPNQPGAKPVTKRQARAADNAYLAGSAKLEKNQPEKALKDFERAQKLDPEKQAYSIAVAITREHIVTAMVHRSQLLRAAGNPTAADAVLADAATIDPQNPIVTEHMQQDEAHVEIEPSLPDSGLGNLEFKPVVDLAANDTIQSFHFQADAHETFHRVLTAYGLGVQFNPDVPSNRIRLDVDNVTFQQMLPILQEMTQCFIVPVDAKTAMVLKSTPENHTDNDHLALETIYMPGFTPDETADAQKVLQNVLEMRHVELGNSGSTLSIRAPESMMKIANYEIADLLDGGSEMLLEMKVYSIDKSNMKNIGVTTGSSITAFNVASEVSQVLTQFQSQIAQAIASGLIPATATPIQILEGLAGLGLLNGNPLASSGILLFGGGLTLSGLSPAALPSLNLGLNQSEARALEDLQLSVADKKTATFRVGTRYPIVTSSYSAGGGAASALAGLSASQLASLGAAGAAAASQVTVPSIQYEDLGLTLKAAPIVLPSGNIFLKIDLKIEALTGSSLDGNPILGNRAFTSNITLKEGQTAMLASSTTRQEIAAVSGIPGLSELPGFQNTTDKNTNIEDSELVITLTPRIVRRGHNHIASVPLAIPQGLPPE